MFFIYQWLPAQLINDHVQILCFCQHGHLRHLSVTFYVLSPADKIEGKCGYSICREFYCVGLGLTHICAKSMAENHQRISVYHGQSTRQMQPAVYLLPVKLRGHPASGMSRKTRDTAGSYPPA